MSLFFKIAACALMALCALLVIVTIAAGTSVGTAGVLNPWLWGVLGVLSWFIGNTL